MGIFDFLKSDSGENFAKLLNYALELHEENDRLRDLCDEKDDAMLDLASENLRMGGSKGGKYLSDYKKYKNM